VGEVGLIFDQIPHAVERDFYLKKLAGLLEVQQSVILQDVLKFNRPKTSSRAAEETESDSFTFKLDRREKLERYLLFLLFEGDDLPAKLADLAEFPFATGSYNQLVTHFLGKIDQQADKKPALKSLVAGLAEDLKQSLLDAIYTPEFLSLKETITPAKEWHQTLAAFKREAAKAQVRTLQEEISQLENQKLTEGQEKQLAAKLRQVVKLQNYLR
jgi:hypothetical protein